MGTGWTLTDLPTPARSTANRSTTPVSAHGSPSADEALPFVNSFALAPPYDVLEEHGFECVTYNLLPDLWEMEVEHG
ncbi:hypothetical protein Hmuk_2011 [Halomicrobium mukohataei DSM 12286]|uniref:Uncharacterized protein n=1 Tax=Halomicrobium mukohataei (strain ATCC 700874 / DSM 12286 / JCM 9738 / NCIMB 13541) TaxID=485914 RepID=C7NVZ5_HALMD|nr:hypothetical protein Hmuk_2011 [Halomicrobium mukohataei DSM 12286]